MHCHDVMCSLSDLLQLKKFIKYQLQVTYHYTSHITSRITHNITHHFTSHITHHISHHTSHNHYKWNPVEIYVLNLRCVSGVSHQLNSRLINILHCVYLVENKPSPVFTPGFCVDCLLLSIIRHLFYVDIQLFIILLWYSIVLGFTFHCPSSDVKLFLCVDILLFLFWCQIVLGLMCHCPCSDIKLFFLCFVFLPLMSRCPSCDVKFFLLLCSIILKFMLMCSCFQLSLLLL